MRSHLVAAEVGASQSGYCRIRGWSSAPTGRFGATDDAGKVHPGANATTLHGTACYLAAPLSARIMLYPDWRRCGRRDPGPTASGKD